MQVPNGYLHLQVHIWALAFALMCKITANVLHCSTSLAWLVGSVVHASPEIPSLWSLPCCMLERWRKAHCACLLIACKLKKNGWHRSHGWLVRCCMRHPRYQGCGVLPCCMLESWRKTNCACLLVACDFKKMVDIARMVDRFGTACVTRDTKVGIPSLLRVRKIAETHSAVQNNSERSHFSTSLAWLVGSVLHAFTEIPRLWLLPCCMLGRWRNADCACLLIACTLWKMAARGLVVLSVQ